MRVEAINLSRQIYDDMGIGYPALPMDEPISMTGLGKCVVVAGKNGSGKTRLLNLLEDVARRYVTQDARQQATFGVAQQATVQRNLSTEIDRLEKQGALDTETEALLNTYRQQFAQSRSEVENLQKTLKRADFLTMSGDGIPNIISLVPKSAKLDDPSSLVERVAQDHATTFASGLSVAGAQIAAPAYARQVMRAAVSERGSGTATDTELQDEETRLHQIISSLLGEDARFTLDSTLNLKLEGVTDSYTTSLSAGQMVLFQLACMLHAGHAALKDYIVFLDEPENHLHPSVLNDIVDRLLVVLTEGQLWIATHSVPLIAHLSAIDPDCLWFAEAGRFKRAGRAPSEVVHDLLGGPDGARRVNELTLLPSRYSSYLLLRQCLLAPGVSPFTSGDPQLNQIQRVIAGLGAPGRPTCVLDFGAGRGRLLDAVAEGAPDDALANHIDYVGYEKYPVEAEACQRRCAEAYGDISTQRVFEDLEAAIAWRGGPFANVAVVCNVLHEIRPSEWLSTIGNGSPLRRAILDDGYVLFVEDYALPVGECAHQYGFLLLDEQELIALFQIDGSDIAEGRFVRNEHPKPGYEKRLVAHLVSASCLSRMTEQSIHAAITCLNSRSLARLSTLLGEKHDAGTRPALGRESALVTQLVANSALWLRDNPIH